MSSTRFRIIAPIMFAVVLCVSVVMWLNHIPIEPPPPQGAAPDAPRPTAMSNLGAPASFSIAAIRDIIATPLTDARNLKGKKGDNPSVDLDLHAGNISTHNDTTQGRFFVDVPISGHVQVEGRIAGVHYGQGLDATGVIHASTSPLFHEDWTIDPRVTIAVSVPNAVAHVRIPLLGDHDVGVSGLVEGKINDTIGQHIGEINAAISQAIGLKAKADELWNSMNRVIQVSKDPPTWIPITPRAVAVKKLHYTLQEIETGIQLSLETNAYLTANAPPKQVSVLPKLKVVDDMPNNCSLTLPIQVSYDIINSQLKEAIGKEMIKLPDVDAWMRFTGCSIQSYGSGVLLKIYFKGRQGWLKSVSGYVYVTGIPHFDPAKSRFSCDHLDYTAETSSLLKSVGWLAKPLIREKLQQACIVDLGPELKALTDKANQELAELKKGLPSQVDLNVKVGDLKITDLLFAKDFAFVNVQAVGTMSGSLK